jgi:hypothetical protein
MIKALTNESWLESVAFVGLVGGIVLLVASFVSGETRLALPALAMLFPSLIWGLR